MPNFQLVDIVQLNPSDQSVKILKRGSTAKVKWEVDLKHNFFNMLNICL